MDDEDGKNISNNTEINSNASNIEKGSTNRSGSGKKTPKRVKRKSVEDSECINSSFVAENKSVIESPQKKITKTEIIVSSTSFLQDKQCWALMKEFGNGSNTVMSSCRDCIAIDQEDEEVVKSTEATTDTPTEIPTDTPTETLTQTPTDTPTEAIAPTTPTTPTTTETIQNKKDDEPIECRFFGWRRLKRIELGATDEDTTASNMVRIEVDGFLGPEDALDKDIKLWSIESSLSENNDQQQNSVVTGDKILKGVGPSFEKIIEYELKMRTSYMKTDSKCDFILFSRF